MKNVLSQPINVIILILVFFTVGISQYFFAVELYFYSLTNRFIIAKVFSVSALSSGCCRWIISVSLLDRLVNVRLIAVGFFDLTFFAVRHFTIDFLSQTFLPLTIFK